MFVSIRSFGRKSEKQHFGNWKSCSSHDEDRYHGERAKRLMHYTNVIARFHLSNSTTEAGSISVAAKKRKRKNMPLLDLRILLHLF